MDLRDFGFLVTGLILGAPFWWVGLKAYERNPDFWHRVWGVPRKRN